MRLICSFWRRLDITTSIFERHKTELLNMAHWHWGTAKQTHPCCVPLLEPLFPCPTLKIQLFDNIFWGLEDLGTLQRFKRLKNKCPRNTINVEVLITVSVWQITQDFPEQIYHSSVVEAACLYLSAISEGLSEKNVYWRYVNEPFL